MNRQTLIIAALALVTVAAGAAILSIEPPAPVDAHDHGHGDEHDHGGGLPDHVDITPDAAKAAGVITATAGPGRIADASTVMGSVVLDPSGHARTNARFPGLIREVRKQIGDKVSAGEALALVESNESLQSYQVKSPIDGIVIARNKNVGEITGDEPLFEVANLSKVWSELHVFPRDIGRIQVGQRVRLSTPDGVVTGEGEIGALLPVTEASSQSVLARVALDNADGRWRPGTAVRGRVVISERPAAVVVTAEAIQMIDGTPVVFVVGNGEFEVRPVLIGGRDEDWAEILEGVYDGEVYAAQGSFLFKAEIGKESAEHEH
ncbi:MAG: efflux RND transporter periplasmic adaptor subunit [Rhodospirillaceae bacterium]|nr:efflux RND transporter periplasmic adaptor subunit [Rhodospirillaceae bacterium]